MNTEEAMKMIEDVQKNFAGDMNTKIASLTMPPVKDTMPKEVKDRIASYVVLHDMLLSFIGMVLSVPPADLTLRHLLTYAKIVMTITDQVRDQMLGAIHDDLEVV